jgi:cobalt-zinc-cadmium efflux system outer membrane protein
MSAVSRDIVERTGQRVLWNRSSAADAEAASAVEELLARELTPESAVQVALLNNRSLQATF